MEEQKAIRIRYKNKETRTIIEEDVTPTESVRIGHNKMFTVLKQFTPKKNLKLLKDLLLPR